MHIRHRPPGVRLQLRDEGCTAAPPHQGTRQCSTLQRRPSPKVAPTGPRVAAPATWAPTAVLTSSQHPLCTPSTSYGKQQANASGGQPLHAPRLYASPASAGGRQPAAGPAARHRTPRPATAQGVPRLRGLPAAAAALGCAPWWLAMDLQDLQLLHIALFGRRQSHCSQSWPQRRRQWRRHPAAAAAPGSRARASAPPLHPLHLHMRDCRGWLTLLASWRRHLQSTC